MDRSFADHRAVVYSDPLPSARPFGCLRSGVTSLAQERKRHESTDRTSDGLYGTSDASGVHGVSTHPRASTARGVYGESSSPGAATFGPNHAASGNGIGAEGRSESPAGIAVTGRATHSGAGVLGATGTGAVIRIDPGRDDGAPRFGRSLRVALLASPLLPIPPEGYAGTERVVAALAEGLIARGHRVTLFGAGDSTLPCEIVPVTPRALWPSGFRGNDFPFQVLGVARAWQQASRFDIIHSHVEDCGFLLARHGPIPVLSTLHSRLDVDGKRDLLDAFSDVPLAAISESQRRWHPGANWVATIHHGLPLERMPFSPTPGPYLALVGRISPEKGIAESIQVARASGIPLRIAAKLREDEERVYFEAVVQPALGEHVEYLGELAPERRDPLLAGARATLMLGAWPEPFGLVAIESLATGTPVIARRAGALPEIIEHGVDGFIVDDLIEAQLAVRLAAGLDRALIRQRALARFGADAMVDAYVTVYRQLIGARRPAASMPIEAPSAVPPELHDHARAQ